VIQAGASLREQVAAFYAFETMLLDDNRLREWLDLIDEDVRYVLPMRETRLGEARLTASPTFYLYNDDKDSLMTRVARLETGMALVESPVSATQRLVTDIHILGHDAGHVDVRSSFLVIQARDEMNETTFAGKRTDRLVIVPDGFRILRREMLLVHYVLPRTISMFF
jgi:3-phenylpropionate/cinnamic acid dioxygenase small subunit